MTGASPAPRTRGVAGIIELPERVRGTTAFLADQAADDVLGFDKAVVEAPRFLLGEHQYPSAPFAIASSTASRLLRESPRLDRTGTGGQGLYPLPDIPNFEILFRD